MAFGEDWLGWTIFVSIIVTIIIIVIKMLIEYPGLTELKCVYKDKDSADNDDLESIGEYYQEREKSKVLHEIPRSIVQEEDDEISQSKLAPSEFRNSDMSDVDEHEEKQDEERVDIIELRLIDEEKDKVKIDVINEKHITTEEHNVDATQTVAIIENTNPGSCSQLLQHKYGVIRQS